MRTERRKNYLRMMPNTYFQFKQFLINQENSGMKVTTDGCLFGAWAANQIKDENPKRILDIGTGTGLLSLMLSQVTNDVHIDALEINKNAYSEAIDNFNRSKWNNRLNCYHSSLQDFQPTEKYDLIICNPPFFKDNFKGLKSDKNQAIHSDTLSREDLINGILKLMNSNGEAFILYPENEMNQFIIEAEKLNLFLTNLITIRNRKEEQVFRMIGKFSLQDDEKSRDEIIIRDSNNDYTKAFWDLLKPYYL